MDEKLINKEWYSGNNCQCGGQVWHFKGENGFRCNNCNTMYGVQEEDPVKEQLSKLKGEKVKEEGIIKKLWNKTVFPDLIKARKERKRVERKRKNEEAEVLSEVKSEARKEALQELKPIIKEKIKEQEIKRITGDDKKEKLQKFANAFSMGGSDPAKPNKYVNALGMGNASELGSDDKISKMLGGMGSGQFGSDDPVSKILGKREERGPQRGRKKKPKPKVYVETAEDKIKRMLS